MAIYASHLYVTVLLLSGATKKPDTKNIRIFLSLNSQRPAMYSLYMLEDRLTEHLNAVDDEAQERMNILVRQMMERQGITEELKACDQMEWVRAVNGIRNMVEEIVLKELVYI